MATRNLANFRAILIGGGWLNRDRMDFMRQACMAVGEDPRIAVFPTPITGDPCTEIPALLELFKGNIESLTPDSQTYPDRIKAARLIQENNLIAGTGGNIAELMKRLRNTGIGGMLLEASQDPTKFFVGSSASTFQWFAAGQGYNLPFGAPKPKHRRYHNIPGLNLLPALVCCHGKEASEETGFVRAEHFRKMIDRQPVGTVGISVETDAALHFNLGRVRVLSANPYSTVQRFVKTNKKVEITTFKHSWSSQPTSEFFMTNTA